MWWLDDWVRASPKVHSLGVASLQWSVLTKSKNSIIIDCNYNANITSNLGHPHNQNCTDGVEHSFLTLLFGFIWQLFDTNVYVKKSSMKSVAMQANMAGWLELWNLYCRPTELSIQPCNNFLQLAHYKYWTVFLWSHKHTGESYMLAVLWKKINC